MFGALLVTIAAVVAAPPANTSGQVEECLSRVKEVHGGAGPWAVAGYRIGEHALKTLGLPRHSFKLSVIHRAPAQVQYSCVADGVQAATGASPGKLNLKIEDVPVAQLSTIVEDRTTGRRLTFHLKDDLTRSICDLPFENLEREGRRIATLPDTALFTVTETKIPTSK